MYLTVYLVKCFRFQFLDFRFFSFTFWMSFKYMGVNFTISQSRGFFFLLNKVLSFIICLLLFYIVGLSLLGQGYRGGIISGLNSDWATCIFYYYYLRIILVIANPRQGKDFWCQAQNSYFIQYECGLVWAKDFKAGPQQGEGQGGLEPPQKFSYLN